MNNYVNDFNEAVVNYYESLKKCKPVSREEEKTRETGKAR